MPTLASPQFPKEQSDSGEFVRQQDAFRRWIISDPNSEFPPEPDRYHLYVSWACPWAHRIIIVRHLKGLQKVVGMSVVDPVRDEKGWAFRDVPGASHDPINGFHYLSEAYQATDPDYQGRVTVPVLWDKKTGQIVSNSDDDLMRILNSAFNDVTSNQLDLYPLGYRTEIDALNETIYETVNNGVYRAGFATTQQAYEIAAGALFKTLDELDDRLATRRFLFGTQPLETDWRLFVTLVRFDAVYHGHFKCNVRRIVDYPNLYGYLRDLYQQPGIAETVNFDHIKRHYYYTHDDINPTRIVPIGPKQDLNSPHGREALVNAGKAVSSKQQN